MATSFCNGCRHWQWISMGANERFKYCANIGEYKLSERKKHCNGKFKEASV